MAERRPVTVSTRIDGRDASHVRVSFFVGRQPDSRGHAGTLTFRIDEWSELHRNGRLTLIEDVDTTGRA